MGKMGDQSILGVGLFFPHSSKKLGLSALASLRSSIHSAVAVTVSARLLNTSNLMCSSQLDLLLKCNFQLYGTLELLISVNKLLIFIWISKLDGGVILLSTYCA